MTPCLTSGTDCPVATPLSLPGLSPPCLPACHPSLIMLSPPYSPNAVTPHSISGISIHPECAVLRLSGIEAIRARLVLDCMGHASPVVKQLRWETGMSKHWAFIESTKHILQITRCPLEVNLTSWALRTPCYLHSASGGGRSPMVFVSLSEPLVLDFPITHLVMS